MDDNALNPYIPNAQGNLQGKVKRPQTPFARISKTVLIIGGVLLVLLAIALALMIPRTTAVDEKARLDFAKVLQPTDQLSKLVTIKSSLGFKLNYQDQLFSSYGEVGLARIVANGASDQISSEHYDNANLRTERQYGLVRVTPLQSVDTGRAAITLPPELEIRGYDKAALLKTDEAKAAEAEAGKSTSGGQTVNKGELALSTFVSIDSKKRLSDKTSDDGTTVTIEATKPSGQQVNGVDYQKVRYTTHNENYRIPTEHYDDCYYTIQNSQPYSACIVNVRPNSVAAAALLEEALSSVAYQAPVAEAVPDTTKKDAPAAKEDEVAASEQITEQDIAAPAYLKSPEILKAIAKNQPNVVRIGTLYCADLALKMADGTTGTTLTDACIGNISSGTFVSKEGHIATTGHAVRYDPKALINGYINSAGSRAEMFERLGRVVDYLVKAKFIEQSDADFLRTGANSGVQDALSKIENFTSIVPSNYVQASNEAYNYAIQPTNKPILLNSSAGNRPVFAYSDAVIQAKFIKSDYDTAKSAQEKFGSAASATDIALLKAEGTFPVATIGTGDTVTANQQLASIGYPAYVDSSLTIDKILNIPVATVLPVNQTFQQDNHKLIQTTVPIIPGNDGAGIVDESGKLAGVGSYGHRYCPDQQCFASGVVHSANELSSLIDKNNIVLTNKSDISDIWAQGVDAYFVGNYSEAASKFAKAGGMYSFSQIATKLVDLSKSKNGSDSDTSLFNQLVGVAIVATIVITVMMIAVGILLVIHLRRLDNLEVGHYGAAAPQPMPQPVQPMAPAPAQYPNVQQGGYAAPPQYQPGQGIPQPAQPQQWSPQQPMQQQPYQQPQQQPQQPPQYSQQPQTPPQAPPQDPFYRP